jgi:hypothetical protein
VPCEVKATPIAARQISALRGPRRKALEAFVTALSVEGCKALGYRLSGAEPLPQLCVKHLRGSDRVVVAFEDVTAWVLLVGPHDEGDRRGDVYRLLYELAGVDTPKSPRTKPACCAEQATAPLIDLKIIDALIARSKALIW